MARIVIVEDEPIIATDLQLLCERSGHTVLASIDSGEEAIINIQKENPELVLLDIALAGKMNGLQVASFLREKQISFIFITSFMDDVTLTAAHKLQPAAYLVKPFQEKNLLANIDLALFKQRRGNSTSDKLTERLFVKHHETYIAIDLSKVLYAEAYDNYTYLYTESEQYLLTQTLKSVEEKLREQGFLRIHKSYVVQLNKITTIQEGFITVSTKKIPIGKVYKKDLMSTLLVF